VDNFVNIKEARRILNAAREGQDISWRSITLALNVTGDLDWRIERRMQEEKIVQKSIDSSSNH